MPAGSNGRATPLGQRVHVWLRGIEQVSGEGGRRLGPLPVGELLHPLALAALVVLLGNDWWAKRVCPGWLTGKLSDVAGLVVAPLALSAAWGCALWLAAALGLRVDPSLGPRRLMVAMAAIAAPFVAAKTSAAAAAGIAAALALLGGRPRIVCDPTDLLALPALLVTWWLGRAELRLVPRGRVHAVLRGARPAAGELEDVRAVGAEPALSDALVAALRGATIDAPRGGAQASAANGDAVSNAASDAASDAVSNAASDSAIDPSRDVANREAASRDAANPASPLSIARANAINSLLRQLACSPPVTRIPTRG